MEKKNKEEPKVFRKLKNIVFVESDERIENITTNHKGQITMERTTTSSISPEELVGIKKKLEDNLKNVRKNIENNENIVDKETEVLKKSEKEGGKWTEIFDMYDAMTIEQREAFARKIKIEDELEKMHETAEVMEANLSYVTTIMDGQKVGEISEQALEKYQYTKMMEQYKQRNIKHEQRNKRRKNKQ